MRLRRRGSPPADVLGLLDRDERVVSWAELEDGAALVATPRGLWWPADDGYRRIGWQFVDKAIWRDSVLSVIEADVVDDLLLVDRPAIHARLSTPRDLPPHVRKRVEGNVVRSELVEFVGGAARLVGRRVPGRDGLVWWARLADGTPDTPAVRDSVTARLSILRDAAVNAAD